MLTPSGEVLQVGRWTSRPLCPALEDPDLLCHHRQVDFPLRRTVRVGEGDGGMGPTEGAVG